MVSVAVACLLAALVLAHGATYLLWAYEGRRSGVKNAVDCVGKLGPWLLEGMALVWVAVTWPFGLVPWRGAIAPGGARPVVLVHGWLLNGASMSLLAARLRADGRIVATARYPSLARDLDQKAACLAAELRRQAAASSDRRVDVVAHGLGGVVLRAAARSPEAHDLLGRVVTLGSPHLGTALALLARCCGLAEVQPRSRYLEDLASQEPAASSRGFTAIASPFDAIVFPLELACWPGAFNITVENVGHCSMLLSALVYTLIRENTEGTRGWAPP